MDRTPRLRKHGPNVVGLMLATRTSPKGGSLTPFVPGSPDVRDNFSEITFEVVLIILTACIWPFILSSSRACN